MNELGPKTKALELALFDPRTDRPMRATYDAGMITAVQEVNYGGRSIAQIIVAGVNAVNCDETYESLRKRWLEARDDQQMVPLEEKPAGKKVMIS
ncbi:MAG: hypothetical protein E6H00_12880 [Bacillati bacterium ANGP1]|uniref:Uncharacterized protein n=1 Tax=Candidatus Segetimicrobium genomatis TaxID=2569760 RepID=A0A537JXQ7_9BACT|nr:MAG: hypothetical protein E6H00_12880 [Terrabacteria group bacterium ANGP1]